MPYQWTDDKIKTLKEKWADGWSGAQIAHLLGTSRNSVIGKVHRLRLPSHAYNSNAPVTPRAKSGPKPKPKADKQARPVHPISIVKPKPKLEEYPPPKEKITSETIKAMECKWPYGDPDAEDFTFCGRERAPPRPYCAHHNSLSYVVSMSRSK